MPKPTKPRIDPLAKIAVAALEDLKGADIKLLDVQGLTSVTDWMVICTGTSNRHTKSLAENVVDAAKQAGTRPLGMQGTETGEWVLVDLGHVVVHVMLAQTRAFYQLEKLWDLKPPVEDEPAPKKTAAKAADKAAVKPGMPARAGGSTGTAAKKTATKKPAARKAGTATKKPAAKKSAAGKPAAKKAAVKKPAAKKSPKA